METQPVSVATFRYQSASISLTDWISLLTLCMAPLLAHIVAGAPKPTYLSPHRPRWHDRVGHYHPTSILWRYLSITDRRIRAGWAWSPADMAAANAIFYTGRAWDGTEEMAERSARYATRLQDSSHVAFFSVSALKTAIITLQGVQALAIVGQVTFGDRAAVNMTFALDGLFIPVSIIGLLRLYAAVWLTEEFAYLEVREDAESPGSTAQPDCDPFLRPPQYMGATCVDEDSKMEASIVVVIPQPTTRSDRLHPLSYWPSRIFRWFFIFNIFAVLFIATSNLIPGIGYHKDFTITSMLVAVVSTIVLLATFLIYSWYCCTLSYGTTIIPCMTATWYKVYMFVSAAMAVLLVISSIIETRKTPCGTYTTKREDADVYLCPGLVYVGESPDAAVFGLASRTSALNSSLDEDTAIGHFIVTDFVGTCQGVNGTNRTAIFTNISEEGV